MIISSQYPTPTNTKSITTTRVLRFWLSVCITQQKNKNTTRILLELSSMQTRQVSKSSHTYITTMRPLPQLGSCHVFLLKIARPLQRSQDPAHLLVVAGSPWEQLWAQIVYKLTNKLTNKQTKLHPRQQCAKPAAITTTSIQKRKKKLVEINLCQFACPLIKLEKAKTIQYKS